MADKIKLLEKQLNDFIKHYQNNPIKYFYEEDIRADLLIKLQSVKEFDIELEISENNEWLKDYKECCNINKSEISGIKAEYPSTTRFDIALIEPNNDYNHYIFSCVFAIEIKLGQKDNQNSGFKLNIEKLKEYKSNRDSFCGIALNFEQNPNVEINDIKTCYEKIKFEEVKSEISIDESAINYFFIGRNFILGGKRIQ